MVRRMAKENNDWGGRVSLEHKQGKDTWENTCFTISRSRSICHDPYHVYSYDNTTDITVANAILSITCVRTLNTSANSTFDTTITTIATVISIALPLILLLSVATYISAITGITIMFMQVFLTT